MLLPVVFDQLQVSIACLSPNTWARTGPASFAMAAAADATELREKMLALLSQFYLNEPDEMRLRTQLKARMFDNGYSIFDVPAMGSDEWVKLGVVGQHHAGLIRQLGALRGTSKSPRTGPGGRSSGSGLADTPWRAGGDAPAPKHAAAAAAGAASWGPVPPPPPANPSIWDSEPPAPAPGGIAAATLAVYHGQERPERPARPEPVRLFCATTACEHHHVPDASVWKYKPLKEFEWARDALWDEKMIERALQSLETVFSVPSNQHPMWYIASTPGMFWKGNPVDQHACFLYMTGDWPNSKTSRTIEIGCLRCGYRSNTIMPWGVAAAGAPCRAGHDELRIVLDGLFMD